MELWGGCFLGHWPLVAPFSGPSARGTWATGLQILKSQEELPHVVVACSGASYKHANSTAQNHAERVGNVEAFRFATYFHTKIPRALSSMYCWFQSNVPQIRHAAKLTPRSSRPLKREPKALHMFHLLLGPRLKLPGKPSCPDTTGLCIPKRP